MLFNIKKEWIYLGIGINIILFGISYIMLDYTLFLLASFNLILLIIPLFINKR